MSELSDSHRVEFAPQVRENVIRAGEAINTMETIADDTFDCIVADPPYNLSDNGNWNWEEKDWGMVSEDWDDDDWSVYEKFTKKWMSEAARVLKPTGTIWVFSSYHNNPYINLGIREHGEILNEIVWFKRNAFPNLTGRRFTASHETICWGHLNGDEREYNFNYDTIKEDFACPTDSYTDAGTQIRSVWDIPTSKSTVEQESDHPTQKPLRLYERIIHAGSDEDDFVFFPFTGSGNGPLSAKLNDRRYFGLDYNVEYAESAQEYVNSIDEKPSMVAEIISE